MVSALSDAVRRPTSSTKETGVRLSRVTKVSICDVKRAERMGLSGEPWGTPTAGIGKEGEAELLIRKEAER